jgi:ankyrin repeat protein
MPRDLVFESADLLARVCQLNQEFDEARGLRNWIIDQDLHPIDDDDILSKTDHVLPTPAMSDAIRWCKEKGFDVDSPGFRFDTPNEGGKTPLHVAVSDEQLEIVEQIVDHVATVETRDNDESTALLLACATRNRHITRVLLNHKAMVNVQDRYLNTPLHRVHAATGGVAVVKLLLGQKDHRININQKNSYDKTALHLACQMGNEPMAELLLDNGADVDSQGPGQCTPLHVAIDQRRLTVVKKLLARGADVTIRDAAGRNAVKAAKTTRLASPDINRLLYEHEIAAREKQRRLSHSRTLSVNEPHVHVRKTSNASLGRRDTVVSNKSFMSGVSNASGESECSSPKSLTSRLALRFGKKDGRDAQG